MLAAMRRHWFLGLLTAYVFYALAFVWNSSVIVDGQRYFVLLDDAMIGMTYGRNLAHGYGVVWYPGAEPVQGYTNPLWVFYMAMVHWLPLPARLMSLPIQLTGVAVIGGTLFFVKAIAEHLAAEGPTRRREGGKKSTSSEPPILAPALAVLLTAFYLPLNNWTLRGLEVGLVALGASLAAWLALQYEAKRRHLWPLLLLLGVLTTVRMDTVILGAVVLAWLTLVVPERRGRTLLAGVAWLAFCVVGQMIAQKLYYNDWLPNTYYQKLGGIPLSQRVVWGLYVLCYYLVGIGLWLIPLTVIYAVAVRSKTVWLLMAMIAGQVSYSVYVGGDAWEWWGGANRYLCVVVPLLFILVASALTALAARFAEAVPAATTRQVSGCVLVLGLLILVQVNSYQLVDQNSIGQWLLLMPPPEREDNAKMIRLASFVTRVTTPRARVAVVWAGIFPYFCDRPVIDLLGKNDRKIAKGPNRPFADPPLLFFRSALVPYYWPGHAKHNYRYSIEELAPDIILQQWFGMEEIIDILEQRYVSVLAESMTILVKKNSSEVSLSRAPNKP